VAKKQKTMDGANIKSLHFGIRVVQLRLFGFVVWLFIRRVSATIAYNGLRLGDVAEI